MPAYSQRPLHVLVCTLVLYLGAAGNATVAQPVTPIREPLTWQTATGDKGFLSGTLRQHGYSSEVVEQLKEARSSPNGFVRQAALCLLAARLRQEAIPLLKEALEDPDQHVRIDATSLLGALGDGSGIPMLRRDLTTLAPLNGLPDPNLKDLQGEDLERARGRWRNRHYRAIQVAEALSELRDPSGLELAARMALEGSAGMRGIAFRVLTNLALCDKSTLSGQVIDPLSVLVAAATSEANPAVLDMLSGSAHRLPNSMAKPVFERLVASPHLREKTRDRAAFRLKRIEKERAGGSRSEGR